MPKECKEINSEQFEALCGIQCTMLEICAVLGVTDKTLSKWCKKTYNMPFSEVFKIKRAGGKASLRRMQWKLAETNATMGIWLGKQYLEQRDEPQRENNNTIIVKLEGFEENEADHQEKL